jgi:uncharacterized membrane protein YcaP (DUF421 family)
LAQRPECGVQAGFSGRSGEESAMPAWLDLDWQRMFVPSNPILETVIRGTCMYLSLFAMLRIFRRQTGSLGAADLLVLLLIADAAQNGMADDYKSITDGLILVTTIIGWEYALDWLAFRSEFFKRIVEREPLELIKDGQIQRQSLDTELMTEDDLRSQLREKGVDDLSVVRRSLLEGNGHISVMVNGRVFLQESTHKTPEGT